MRNNFFQTNGYSTELVAVIIKGFSEKAYVCPFDWQQIYLNKERLGINVRKEGRKWFVLFRGGDNYGGEFETQVIEDNSVTCSKPRFEGPYQKLGFLRYEGQSAKGTFLEDGYILSEEGQYLVYE